MTERTEPTPIAREILASLVDDNNVPQLIDVPALQEPLYELLSLGLVEQVQVRSRVGWRVTDNGAAYLASHESRGTK